MITSTLLTVGLAGMAVAAPLLPTPTLKKRVDCVEGLYIIAARGSNEAPGEGKPGIVASMIVDQVPGSTSVAVVYPATIISSSSDYISSVTDGINDTKELIQDYVDSCGSSSQIVLLGYSQGGNVMTDVLAGGVDKPAPLSTDYSQYLTGVAVWGDPTFDVGQSFDVGTATKSGIFARSSDGASLALLNTYAGIIQSYCNEHDPFCASGDDLAVHTSEVEDYATAATNFIVGMVQ